MIAAPDPNSDANLRRLLAAGSEVAGGAIGAALSFLASGPISAASLGMAGAAIGAVLRHIGEDAADRLLAPREQVRVGGVLALIAAEVQTRTAAGEALRSDGFFRTTGRGDAEEIAEAILMKAQREAEEAKLPYIAHLYAYIAFDPTVSPALAHQLLKAAEQLTFRQFCLLRLGASVYKPHLRPRDYREQHHFSRELYQVLFELHELYLRGYIHYGGEAALGPKDAIPVNISPQGIGADLHNGLLLANIPTSDLDALARILQ